jgi:hypothetical protein
LVEHRTENPGVGSSTLPLPIVGVLNPAVKSSNRCRIGSDGFHARQDFRRQHPRIWHVFPAGRGDDVPALFARGINRPGPIPGRLAGVQIRWRAVNLCDEPGCPMHRPSDSGRPVNPRVSPDVDSESEGFHSPDCPASHNRFELSSARPTAEWVIANVLGLWASERAGASDDHRQSPGRRAVTRLAAPVGLSCLILDAGRGMGRIEGESVPVRRD